MSKVKLMISKVPEILKCLVIIELFEEGFCSICVDKIAF